MVDATYYGTACPCCGRRSVRAASVGVSFDEKMLEGFLREIYDEEVVPSEGGISEQLYEATRDIFEQATAQGMAQSRNKRIVEEEDFLKHYTHSIEVFSAFRTHRYGEMMASMLHDEEGRLRPFEEWRKATESIQNHFNRSWLETEYSTAILRAQQAADWKGFERDKDIAPNLTWMPTSSADPREEHAVFWRDALTLPVDDPFWDEHRPGDLWNCKCWLKQTDAQATPQRAIPKGKDVPKPAKGLEQNPGKTAEMFSSKQPHYPNPKTCIWLKLAKGKGAEARAGRFRNAAKCIHNCNLCEYIVVSKRGTKETGSTLSKEKMEEAKKEIELSYVEWRANKNGGCRLSPTKIGETPKYIADFLRSKNVEIGNADIVISAKQLSHMFSKFKESINKAIDFSDLIDFIENMKSYNAAYDPRHGNFVMFKYKNDDSVVKFVVSMNEKIKGYGKSNVVVTAGKVMNKTSLWSNGVELIRK
ncbi:MAG: hypothetical protein IKZ67_03665 [Paludibacteraceae bacterium]|nr:hypothetical protein [Paludibacteraceae bacterium]